MSAELELMKNEELTDEKMNELVEKAESGPSRGREIPMSKEEAPKESPPEPQHIEFDHRGKKIRGTQEQLIRWAQMGIDYPQMSHQLKNERSQWENQKKEWEQQWGGYAEIDKWAKSNPAQWQMLVQNLQRAQSGQPLSDPAQAGATPTTAPTNDLTSYEIQALKQKIAQLEPLVQTINSDFTTSKQQSEDHALDQEIQSIREKYKDLDWDTPDDQGRPLEYKVLEFASENGLKSFDQAFKALCHDMLIERAANLAKQNVSKTIQNNTKLGYLGKTPTPTRGVTAVKDVKNKSYNEIEAEIRDELSRGLYG